METSQAIARSKKRKHRPMGPVPKPLDVTEQHSPATEQILDGRRDWTDNARRSLDGGLKAVRTVNANGKRQKTEATPSSCVLVVQDDLDLNVSLSSMKSTSKATNALVQGLGTQLDSMGNKLDVTDGIVNGIDDTVNDIQATANDISPAIEEVKDAVDEIKTEVDGIREELAEVRDMVDEIKQKLEEDYYLFVEKHADHEDNLDFIIELLQARPAGPQFAIYGVPGYPPAAYGQ